LHDHRSPTIQASGPIASLTCASGATNWWKVAPRRNRSRTRT